MKSLCYGDAVLAAAEARAAGCGDALFLNGAGRVACAGAGNVFAVFGSDLATPPSADGVLDGITRDVLLNGAASIGLTPIERSLSIAELESADALVCTSSLRLVAPVVAIGSRPMPESYWPAALARLVAQAVAIDVGVDPRTAMTS